MWSQWTSLKPLSEPVEVHRLEMVVATGGHRRDVFADETDELDLVVRPWQRDQFRVTDEGALGETPGLKAYAGLDDGLNPPRRGDRVHYEGNAWRVTNPQVAMKEDVLRIDLRTDERELITESEINVSNEDIREVDPERHQFDQY